MSPPVRERECPRPWTGAALLRLDAGTLDRDARSGHGSLSPLRGLGVGHVLADPLGQAVMRLTDVLVGAELGVVSLEVRVVLEPVRAVDAGGLEQRECGCVPGDEPVRDGAGFGLAGGMRGGCQREGEGNAPEYGCDRASDAHGVLLFVRWLGRWAFARVRSFASPDARCVRPGRLAHVPVLPPLCHPCPASVGTRGLTATGALPVYRRSLWRLRIRALNCAARVRTLGYGLVCVAGVYA